MGIVLDTAVFLLGYIKEFINMLYEALYTILVFIVGLYVIRFISVRLYVRRSVALKLYLWHTLFGFIYVAVVSIDGGDAANYYNGVFAGGERLEPGTFAVEYLCVKLKELAAMPYLAVSMLFSFVGAIGLLIYYKLAKNAVLGCKSSVRKMAEFSAFLPSMSFWTSGVGKDSLSYMALMLFMYALVARAQLRFLAGGVLIMYIVRPHVAVIMIFSLMAGAAFGRGVSLLKRSAVVALAIGFLAIALPVALEKVRLESWNDLSAIETQIELRQGYNKDGAGAVDITNSNFLVKASTYVLRPLPHEARNPAQLIAAIEHLFLIFLIILTYSSSRVGLRGMVRVMRNHAALIFYFLAMLAILSSTTSNLGIAARQKWMFLPILFWFLFLIQPRMLKNSKNLMSGSLR